MNIRQIAVLFTAVLIGSMIYTVPTSAADTTKPRIIKAAMKDVDKDDKSDRVVLTYSEKIRHPLDQDGHYSFRVGNRGIKRVRGASGTTKLIIDLKEKASKDIGAKPSVSYRKTQRQAVTDRAGNQAKEQTFSRTVPLDVDNDGYAKGDCRPRNAAIHPGATDEPDTSFIDANCDKVDGTTSNAVFVATNGDDLDPGTRAAPKATMPAALAAAEAAGKDVYVGIGTYFEDAGVQLLTDVSIFGGYDTTTNWTQRRLAESDTVGDATLLQGPQDGMLADGATGVVVQNVVAEAVNGYGESHLSNYGVRAINGSYVTLEAVIAIAADGLYPGANGAFPGNGVSGNPGADAITATGGAGGAATSLGNGGGAGADGQEGASGDGEGATGGNGSGGALGGTGGTGGGYQGTGGDGGPGDPGPDGADGAHGAGGDNDVDAGAGDLWFGSNGSNGGHGTKGEGGGGGGSGGSYYTCSTTFPCPPSERFNWLGGGGGGGGGGATGGVGGPAGWAGGGSFGIYIADTSFIYYTSGEIFMGNGGDGQEGKAGGSGGTGGAAGQGAEMGPGGPSTGAGGDGGEGGDGGDGGAGGGGAGGASCGVFRADPSASYNLQGAVVLNELAQGGDGGPSPGNDGATGFACFVHP